MTTSDERVFVNGRIFTSNPEQLYASAMIVREDKIVWIGDENDVVFSENSVKVDLGGKRVLPGFIDAHLHPLYLANTYKQIPATPPLVHSIEDLKEEIIKRRQLQRENEWIEAWGYDEGKLKEHRSPNRWDLDEAVDDAPVIVMRACAHIAVVNSYALELAGIDKSTPDPAGGKIERDASGEATGVLKENAIDLMNNIKPTSTLDEEAEDLANLSKTFFSFGITGITELMATTKPVDYLEIYEKAREKGLQQRTVLYYKWEVLKENSILHKKNTNRKNPIHIGGIKVFSDGSISGRTAWVNPSYLGEEEEYGIKTTSKQELLEAAEEAKKHQVQLVVHAMGEKAIDLVVHTFYEMEGWMKEGPSVRVEHASLPTEQALQRASQSSIGFVLQPIFLFAEIESYLYNLGKERTKQAYPIKSMLASNIPVALSSDAPATPWADPVNPFIGIKSAVTRLAYDLTDTGQDEKIDLETALILYTKGAQELTQIPNVGQLTEGYYADFMVLDQDILHLRPEQIDKVKVEKTYMGGHLVYQKQTDELKVT